VHAYFFHSFDLGLRLKRNELARIRNLSSTMELDEEGAMCTDKGFKSIAQILRKNSKKIKTFHRYKKSHKYLIDKAAAERKRKAAVRPEPKADETRATWKNGLFTHLEEHGLGYVERRRR